MSADRSRSQFTYQLVAGAVGMAIGLALGLVVAHLTDQAPWTFLVITVLPGSCALTGVFVGNRIWRRRKYGKGE